MVGEPDNRSSPPQAPSHCMTPPTPCSWIGDERLCRAAAFGRDHKACLGVVEVSHKFML